MGLRELMRMEAQGRLASPEKVNSLEYLQRIYRDPNQPTPVRMRAAIEALSFENPKLTAIGVGSLDGQDFYSRLERALKRTEQAREMIELEAVQVDDSAVDD
jgi:uncharacterized membrane protein